MKNFCAFFLINWIDFNYFVGCAVFATAIISVEFVIVAVVIVVNVVDVFLSISIEMNHLSLFLSFLVDNLNKTIGENYLSGID